MNHKNQLYDLTKLNQMVYGDRLFLKELIEVFIEHTPKDANRLIELTKSQNWEEASKIAHKLKSSIHTIGITSLGGLIAQIESNAREQNHLDVIQEKVELFVQTLNKVIEHLKKESFETE